MEILVLYKRRPFRVVVYKLLIYCTNLGIGYCWKNNIWASSSYERTLKMQLYLEFRVIVLIGFLLNSRLLPCYVMIHHFLLKRIQRNIVRRNILFNGQSGYNTKNMKNNAKDHTVLLKQQQFNETMCFQATIKWDHVFPNNNSMRPCVSKQQLDKIMCFKVIVCIFSIMFGVHCQLIAHKTSWWNRFTSFLHGKHVYHQLRQGISLWDSQNICRHYLHHGWFQTVNCIRMEITVMYLKICRH
jgi:hypothetical protein